MGRNDMDSYWLVYRGESEKGIWVSEGIDDDFSLPKSEITYQQEPEPTKGDEVEVEIPEWLARSNGLI